MNILVAEILKRGSINSWIPSCCWSVVDKNIIIIFWSWTVHGNLRFFLLPSLDQRTVRISAQSPLFYRVRVPGTMELFSRCGRIPGSFSQYQEWCNKIGPRRLDGSQRRPRMSRFRVRSDDLFCVSSSFTSNSTTSDWPLVYSQPASILPLDYVLL